MIYIIILIVSLVLCAPGFKKYVYFFSIGYGFAIAGIGVTLMLLFRESLTWGTVLACVLFLLYGLRLGGFLLLREMRSAEYHKFLDGEVKKNSAVPIGVQICIWLACGILYFLQTSPVLFRLMNGKGTDTAMVIGVILMAAGILLEIAADKQKASAKGKDPGRFVDTGLFRLVRCPNYLGELVLWTGVFISGIPVLTGAFQWTIAVLGYLGIIYVMFSGARRLEIRQNRNYGEDPEYREYVKTVPIMIPFIPLYSVENWKLFVA